MPTKLIKLADIKNKDARSKAKEALDKANTKAGLKAACVGFRPVKQVRIEDPKLAMSTGKSRTIFIRGKCPGTDMKVFRIITRDVKPAA